MRSANRLTGFTIIELLVVIAVISLLVSILLPSLARARALARQVTCLTRVGGQIRAIHMYASSTGGLIPCGPDFAISFPGGYAGPPMNTVASNQIWIGEGRTYNAHGVLLGKGLLPMDMMWCPDDDSDDPIEELSKLKDRSSEDSYCSYLYRQLDGRAPGGRRGLGLDSLGVNPKGTPVSALVMDINSLLEIPGVPVRTNHRAEKVSVGFAEGHAKVFPNPDHNLTLRHGDEGRIFDRLDEILEYADSLCP
jgi:prepilin-type N-terminal cleavage/methylation domain-containing protein